ncbi:chorismate synthase, partial [Streptomyces pharetrae]
MAARLRRPPAGGRGMSRLRWLTAGESHGPALVATLEGLPAGVPVTT